MNTSPNNTPSATIVSTSVVNHNNAGVALINGGNIEQAIMEFKAALMVSREQLLSNKDSSSEDPNSTSSCSNSSCQQQQQETNLSLDEHMRRSSVSAYEGEEVDADGNDCTMVDSDDGALVPGCYIYRRPISVVVAAVTPSCSSSELNLESDIIVSAAVLFNMALSYQLLATQTSDNHNQSLTYLRKAVQLYEYAYSMQRDELSFHQTNPLYMLAIVNNMAVAYQCLNEYNSSQGLFQHMLSTIMFLVDCGISGDVDGDGRNGGQRHALDGFLRNVSQLIGKCPTATAA